MIEERHVFIDGRVVEADDRSVAEVRDPATDELVGRVPRCGVAETHRAIDAAARAFPAWRKRLARERADLLLAMHDAMLRRLDTLAETVTRECGKPLAEARREVAYAAGFLRWAAGEAERMQGETIPSGDPAKRIMVLRQPVGVVAAITPWNFPAAMVTRKLGPALAAGCTFVLRPASKTPLTALAMGDIAQDIGLPSGVLNIVTGPAELLANELVGNPLVRKLTFTGSTEVGRSLLRKSADNMLRISLELGGLAPFIVFDDADVNAAVQGAMASKFRNAGQTCVCANRFYVQEGIYAEFVAGMKSAMEKLVLGHGLDERVTLGPLVDDAAVAKVTRHVEDARHKAARTILGGDRVHLTGLAERFFAPTLLEDARPDMLVMCEETFGPVVPVSKFASEAEVVALANHTAFGLAGYFYSRDAGRIWRVAEALECGIVGANDGLPSTPQAPFGGVKQSGFGREGGHHAMHEYLDIKYVSWGV